MREQYWYDYYKAEYGDKLINKIRPVIGVEWNKKYLCECGGEYLHYVKTAHPKSRRHQNYLKQTLIN